MASPALPPELVVVVDDDAPDDEYRRLAAVSERLGATVPVALVSRRTAPLRSVALTTIDLTERRAAAPAVDKPWFAS